VGVSFGSLYGCDGKIYHVTLIVLLYTFFGGKFFNGYLGRVFDDKRRCVQRETETAFGCESTGLFDVFAKLYL
jgi:hypothetical protein